METIKVKYIDKDLTQIEKIEQGDWLDLRVSRVDKFLGMKDGELEYLVDGHRLCYFNSQFKQGTKLVYEKGDIIRFGLGVAMELPEGYEAYIVPRSSTRKSTGLIQTNSVGIIDNSYSGDEDEWLVEFYAIHDGSIEYNQRVCQFRIQERMPKINIDIVDHLGNESRGGYGTTGDK